MTRVEIESEEQLGAVVVAWLEALGADVYQEVGDIDIVARVGVELWIVEVKRSLSLRLLVQGMDRRRRAHRVFIATPATKHMRDVGELCEALGIGLWQVDVDCAELGYSGRGHGRVVERVASRRWNSRPVALAKQLAPEHKTHAKAGTAGGGRWTPFRDTCEQLSRIVRGCPGIALKAAIEQTKHHYRTPASARSSLRAWIEKGRVPGVALRGGALFPEVLP